MSLSGDDLKIRAEVVANLPALIEKAVLAGSWRYAEPTEDGFVIRHDFYASFLLDGTRFSVRIVVGERPDGRREVDYAEHARMPAASDKSVSLAALVNAFEQ